MGGEYLVLFVGSGAIIFGVLGEQAGAKFVQALFPRFYLWGAIAGAIALPAFVAGPLCYHEFRGPMVGVQAMVILAGILCMLYGANSLTPAINQRATPGRRGRSGSNYCTGGRRGLMGLSLPSGWGCWWPSRRDGRSGDLGPERAHHRRQARYDAAVSRVIEDIEARHGMRRRRTGSPGESAARPDRRRRGCAGDRSIVKAKPAGLAPRPPDLQGRGTPNPHRVLAPSLRSRTKRATRLWRTMTQLT